MLGVSKMAMAILDFFFGFLEGITRSAAMFAKLVLVAAFIIYLVARSVDVDEIILVSDDSAAKPIFNKPIQTAVHEAGQVFGAEFHVLSERCRWVLGSAL